MKQQTETLADDNGIEVLVAYDYEREPDYCEEPGNPATLVKGMTYTELTSFEIVIKGKGIDILNQLTEKQKEFIIEQLSYNS